MPSSTPYNTAFERYIFRARRLTETLQRFHIDLEQGRYIDLEQIKDIERANPNAHSDADFSKYASDFRSGKIKRPRGRPPRLEHNEPWLKLGEDEYNVLQPHLTWLNKRQELADWLDEWEVEVKDGDTPAMIAARLVIKRRKLPISIRTLQNRVSASRRKSQNS